jgi:poly(glycerol-phosphate) alpha-glucosyltransferase
MSFQATQTARKTARETFGRKSRDGGPFRVLHVVRGLANSSGVTHIVSPLAEEQANQGIDVSLFYVRKSGETAVEPDPGLVESRCFDLTLPFNNPGVSLGLLCALRNEVGRYDLVHIHAVWNFPTYVAMRSANAAKRPYVVSPQGSYEPWALKQNRIGKRIYGKATEIPLINRAACVQALTSKEVDQLRRYGIHAPCVVVPNGVSTSWTKRQRQPLTDQLGLDSAHRTLLFLSRLHPKKGLDILIRGFALADVADLTLVVAGHDAGSGYAGELKRIAAESGVRPVFLGEVAGTRKFDVLLGADAFALTSHSEGLPIAVIEAMAAGLPVAISTGCNLPEVADRTAGLVIPSEPECVANAIKHLFSEDCDRSAMGRAGQALVEDRFTWKRIAQQLIALYEELALHPEARTQQ